MTLHQISATLRNSAREKLSGRYGNAVLLTLTHNLIIFAASFIVALPISFVIVLRIILTKATELGAGFVIAFSILMLFFNIFAGVFNTGVSLFFLNMACERTASITDLFYGFRRHFKKSLAVSAVNVVVSTVPLIPYNICYYIYQTNTTNEWAFWTILSYIAGTAISLPISLGLAQSFFLILDFPQYSAGQVLAVSMRLMKGHKWKLFYIQLSFYPLILLSMLTLGIGNLWLDPYRNLTMALFFLDIMKPKATVTEA